MRAIFLDKDGTLVEDVPYNIDPGKVRLCKGVTEALRLFQQQGYRLFIITNQPGVAMGLFEEPALATLYQYLSELFAKDGITLDGFYYCPHSPQGVVADYAVECSCRKPQPGMLVQAAREHKIDLSASWMIGDILHDVECGRRAGCRTVLIDNGNETEWQLSALRTPDLMVPDIYTAARMICQSDHSTLAMNEAFSQ